MIALKQPLQKCVTSLARKPKAAIIDDEVINKDEKSSADWIALKEVLQKTPGIYEEIQKKFDLFELPIASPPPTERWMEILKVVEIKDQDAQRAITQYDKKHHVIRKLEVFLSDIGFDLVLLAKRPDIRTLKDVDLFLVDFQMLPEENSGDTAVQLIRELMELSASLHKTPPMVVLMSKAINSQDAEKWGKIATKSGYFRFNYEFLSKADFEQDSSLFSLLLLNLLEHKPVADCYYSQIRSLLAETNSIATSVMNDLFQITPPEAQVFKNRIEKEGVSLSEVFTDLFTEHFAQSLKNSPIVIEKMAALEKAVNEHGVFAPPEAHRHALHKLYAELLYTNCGATPSLRPDFGDIYSDAGGKYLLVLTQECDLMRRGEKGPKVDRVLTIEGTLHDSDVSEENATSIVSKPIVPVGEDKLRWLWWDIRKPVVITYGDLSGPSYNKMWRLKFDDAEDIQHQFSYSLTRVALDVTPGFVSRHECRLFSERKNAFLDSSVSLYEVAQGDQLFLAFAPDCRAFFFGLEFPFLSLENILELGRFISKAAFVQKLKSHKIYVYEEGGSLVLFKSKAGAVPKGKAVWSETAEAPVVVEKPETVAPAAANNKS